MANYNVEIIRADWKTNLGRSGDQFGLQLVVQAENWASCIEVDQPLGIRILGAYGIIATQQLVGKWCVVEADNQGASIIKFIGPLK